MVGWNANHDTFGKTWHTDGCIEASVELWVLTLRVLDLIRNESLSRQVAKARLVVHEMLELVLHEWLHLLKSRLQTETYL